MPIYLEGSDDLSPHTHNDNDGDIEVQSVASINRRYKQTYYYRILKFSSRLKLFHIPVLNWMILVSFIYLLYKLILKYEEMYKKNVISTTVTANVLLFGLSDTLAQNVSCFLSEIAKNRSGSTTRLGGTISLENYNNQNGYKDSSDDEFIYTDFGYEGDLGNQDQSIYQETAYQHLADQTDKDIFNFRRFVGFMFWGFTMAFCQVAWYKVLNNLYTTEPTFVSVLARVMSDQLVYSPISLFCFFSYSNFVLEGGTKATLADKISKIYFSTLMANYMLWPMVQFINFLVMPHKFQVPFSSSIGVLWNCFVSMKNASN